MSNNDDEPLRCSVCLMAAFAYCSECDDAICEICGVDDESIILCYECWQDRETELSRVEEAIDAQPSPVTQPSLFSSTRHDFSEHKQQ